MSALILPQLHMLQTHWYGRRLVYHHQFLVHMQQGEGRGCDRRLVAMHSVGDEVIVTQHGPHGGHMPIHCKCMEDCDTSQLRPALKQELPTRTTSLGSISYSAVIEKKFAIT